MNKALCVGLMALFGLAARASVVPGEMNSSFQECKDYSEREGVPLVLVWSASGCHYCEALETVLESKDAKARMKELDYVFCHVTGDEQAKEFASTANGTKPDKKSGKLTSYPFVCAYWPGTHVDNFTGRSPSGGYMTADQFFAKVAEIVGDYGKTASFLVGNTIGDRLEAEVRTGFVDVPLVRSAGGVSANVLKVVQDGSVVQTETVIWAVGETVKSVRVETKSRYAKDAALTLDLYDDAGKKSASSAITFVARENSPKNPTWKGVTDFGEWTMDLDAAQGLAGRAYTLALVGGSMWCPDCAKTDAYFVDAPEFKAWARQNKVACVAVDIPNWSATAPTTGPCLLTREVREVSESYIAADPEHGAKQSGAGYLSRWEISTEEAAKKLEDNRKLAGTSTLNGGWNRPERSNQYRTGVPIFILLNGDGSVAGRFEDFASTSPTVFNSAYIDRMDDLLETAGGREDCLSWMTATTADCQLPVAGGTASSFVSSVRRTNWWKLTGVNSWLRGTFVLKGARESGAPGEENAVLNLYRKEGSEVTQVKTVRGNLFNGLTLANVALDTSAEWFVQVEALAASEAFSTVHAGRSHVDYSLTATAAADAGTTRFSSSARTVKEADVKKVGGVLEVQASVERIGGASGILVVPVEIDAGSTAEPDRYELVDEAASWEDGDRSVKGVRVLVYDDANADGTQDLVLKVGESRYVLTIVDNDRASVGKISISEAKPAIGKSRTVIATEGTKVAIGVSRVDGASGRVSATLTTDAGVFDDDSELVWENRQSETIWRTLTLPKLVDAPKNGLVTVKLGSVSGAKANASTKSLKVQLVATNAPCFERDRLTLTTLARYVAASSTDVGILNVDGAKKVLVKKISGSLPSGLKASVDGNRFVISRMPTCKAGAYSAVYQVSAQMGRTTVKGLTICVECVVTDFTELPGTDPGANPFVKKSQTLSDLMVLDVAAVRLVGEVSTLSVNSRGKLAAKFVCDAGTITLSSDSWSDYDPATGDLTAHLTSKKTAHTMDVRVSGTDGKVEAKVYGPGIAEQGADVIVPEAWNTSSNSAEDWMGCYTVDFFDPVVTSGNADVAPMGDVTLTLQMTSSSDIRKGRMRYKGVFPNGRSFGGVGTLVRTGEDTVVLPIFCKTSREIFFAAPQIDRTRPAKRTVVDWSSVSPCWTHKETKTACGDYEIVYQTAGSPYDRSFDLKAIAEAAGGSANRLFEAAGCALSVPVTIQPKKPVADASLAKASALKLSFTQSTGVISGSFKFADAAGVVRKATYKGVVLPDWDGCPTCGDRPWAAGAFWYSDRMQFADCPRALSVVVGDGVLIELAE